MNIQYLLVLLFACAAGGMTYVLAGEPFRKPLARARMSIAARKGMHAKPTQRMKIAEAIDRAGEAFEKVIPLKLSESRELQDKLDLAGLKITPSTWRAISLGITIFTAIMLAGAALVGGYGIAMALLVGIIGAVGGWLYSPAAKKIFKRSWHIEAEPLRHKGTDLVRLEAPLLAITVYAVKGAPTGETSWDNIDLTLREISEATVEKLEEALRKKRSLSSRCPSYKNSAPAGRQIKQTEDTGFETPTKPHGILGRIKGLFDKFWK